MKKITIIILTLGLSIFMGTQLGKRFDIVPAPEFPSTMIVEDQQGAEQPLYSTGKAFYPTPADQNIHLGYSELETLIARGPHTDSAGRFRLAPNPDRFRLVIYVTRPIEPNLQLAKTWLINNKFAHIPDFKIDVVETATLNP